ncbi:hypothetical protein GCM10008966_34130 [Rhodovulum strictum]
MPDRKGLTGAEVSRIVSEAADLIDRNEIEEARREGLLDAVDFLTPRFDDAFYLGVDVQPGHVAAGLTVSRPQEEAAVRLGVEQRGRALICGPSGAGKSAIMWQAAAASRDAVRWYRLYDLGQDDLPQLARYLRALRVAAERPVGLILDDAGRRLSGAWARASELADRMPGLVLLGSCREEDLGQIGTLASVQLVRPLPNDELAEALWRKLSEERQTDWQGWAEPWEQSRGLLMEYAHLLSSQTRLRSVLHDQVGIRIADEGRDHETDILRIASCAGASGARLTPSHLRAQLGVTAGDTSRALRRLIEEHVVRQEDDGLIAPLHQLRSQVLFDELHADGSISHLETLSACVACIVPKDLPLLLRDRMTGEPETDALMDACISRIVAETTPAVFKAILDGLGDVDAARLGSAWLETGAGAAIEPGFRHLAMMFALTGADLPASKFSDRLRLSADAYGRLAGRWLSFCRRRLLEGLPDGTLDQLLSAEDPDDMSAMLEAMVGISPVPEAIRSRLHAISPLTKDMSFLQRIRLCEAIQEVDRSIAQAWADGVGRTRNLQRVRDEVPFTTLPRIEERDGLTVAVCEVIHLADGLGEDPHAAVVAICDALFALFPEVERTDVEAVDADGIRLAIRGMDVAAKRMPRSNHHSKSRTNWNRRLVRAVPNGGDVNNRTAFLSDVLSLAARLRPVSDRLWDRLVRGKLPAEADLEELGACHEGARALFSPYPAFDKPKGEADPYEDARDVLFQISADLVRRFIALPEGANALAAKAGELAEKLIAVRDNVVWTLIPEPDRRDLDRLADLLRNLKMIAWDHGARGERLREPRKQVKAARRGNAVNMAARLATARLETETVRFADCLQQTFQAAGYSGSLIVRPPESTDVPGPAEEVIAIFDADDVLGAADQTLAVYQTLRDRLPATVRLTVLPHLPVGVAGSLGVAGYADPLPTNPSEGLRQTIAEAGEAFAATPLVDLFTEALWGATVLGNARRAGRSAEHLPRAEREAMAEAERALVRSRSQLLNSVAEMADLIEGLGRFLDDLAIDGRAMMSDVPLLDGDGVDAFAERRGVLVLSLLMLDLEGVGDRIVDARGAGEKDRMGREVVTD